MRLKDRPLLGIELHEGELRIAVVTERSSGLEIEAAAHTKLPHGSLRNGVVVETGSVAVALKRLIDLNGLGGVKDAVIGVPAGGTIVRNLQVPNVSDTEMPQIVAGEVDHYAIVNPGGAHSYLRLHAPPRVEGELTHVVVAAAEAGLIASLSDVAARADLNIVALEPVEFAMSRTALATLGATPTAFVLSISETTTNISFVLGGRLWAYRQVDTGATALLPSIRSKGVAPEAMLDRASVLAFSKEIKRTIEYLHRTYPEIEQLDAVHLVTNEPDLVGLPLLLSDFLGIMVQLHVPGLAIASSGGGNLDSELMTLEGVRYTAAAGLALRANRAAALVAPPMDLFASERMATKAGLQKRNLGISFSLAGAALLLGIAGMGLYQKQIAAVEGASDDLTAQAIAMKQNTDVKMQSRAVELDQYKLLRSEGVPLVPLMDYLTGSMPPQTGLSSIQIDPNKLVRISGESTDEEGVMSTLRSLQAVPVITNPRLESMRNDPEKGGITFTIAGAMVGTDRVRLPRRGTP
jgi:Tfp pilus assembly PilM family ATPase